MRKKQEPVQLRMWQACRTARSSFLVVRPRPSPSPSPSPLVLVKLCCVGLSTVLTDATVQSFVSLCPGARHKHAFRTVTSGMAAVADPCASCRERAGAMELILMLRDGGSP